VSLALSTPLEPNSGFLVAGDVGHSSSLLLLVLLGTFAVYCFPGAFALQRVSFVAVGLLFPVQLGYFFPVAVGLLFPVAVGLLFPGAFALQRNFHDAFRRMFLRGGDYCVSEVRISTVDADTVS
jgi:hypothetical protein|tara:strand:- start:372 stop:743 length:372 start_codon:yes stop_codon:yes gene_type:complete